jgi:hypothetical protein
MGSNSLSFRIIPNPFEHPSELGQAFWLVAMVVSKYFNLRPQYRLPWFVPIEMTREAKASLPNLFPISVNGYTYIKQVLDVYVL